MQERNRRIVLAARPVGEPRPEDFRIEETEAPRPGEGQALLRTIYVSVDPYMRGRMNAGPSYAPPVELGHVMGGDAVSEVVESRAPEVRPGDVVVGHTGWQEYAAADAKTLRKLDPAPTPVTLALGVLGMPGMTAYTGLLNLGEPKPGETVLVSAASGAVGSVVGQIARIKECRAVGIAGGPEKCSFVRDKLGFHDCVDHRSPDFAVELKAACPQGVDIYFENVGGKVFQAVLPLLNPFARVPVCGLIAHYNATELPPGPDRVPAVMAAILVKRLMFRGFIVTDYATQWPEFSREVSGWLREGRIKYREDVIEGIEDAPDALIGMLKGRNFGKLLVKVS